MLLRGCVYEHAHLSVNRRVYEPNQPVVLLFPCLTCAGTLAGIWHSLAVQSLGSALTRPWFESWLCYLVVCALSKLLQTETKRKLAHCSSDDA